MTIAAPDSALYEKWHREWRFPDGVTYLNHGSFGPSPIRVQNARQEWSATLERQPMDFYLRQMELAIDGTVNKLSEFVGVKADGLIAVDNATVGMNIVARSIELNPGDEILTTTHDYGAVLRLWRSACRDAGAELKVQHVDLPVSSSDEIAETIVGGITARTKLLIVSHVTSVTGTIFPVQEICRRAHEKGVPVCVDGPHAIAMIPLAIRDIGCDFYTASCHKWLCGPFGSGFLYVDSRYRRQVKPSIISWGGSVSGRQPHWKDEFNWLGTRDPAPFVAVSTAIDVLRECGLEAFRGYTHALARYARARLVDVTGLEPLIPDGPEWYGSMISLPLAEGGEMDQVQGYRDPLQDRLWENHRIEIPIMHWQGRRFIRVSCHLYNCPQHVDYLAECLAKELAK